MVLLLRKQISEVEGIIKQLFPQAVKIVSAVPDIASLSAEHWQQQDPHALEDVTVGVISSLLWQRMVQYG